MQSTWGKVRLNFPTRSLFLTLCLASWKFTAHAALVRGVVFERGTNRPLPGIMVLLPGGESRTSREGGFRLQAPEGEFRLTIRVTADLETTTSWSLSFVTELLRYGHCRYEDGADRHDN